jgi:hypothetical protein
MAALIHLNKTILYVHADGCSVGPALPFCVESVFGMQHDVMSIFVGARNYIAA